MLRSFQDVEIVGEAENGIDAVKVIERERPDLAFLDLQMPEVDGLGVVRLLKKNRTPLIAFVTAYDQYAIQAFEVNAVDYLLKPVERTRLRETLNRAQEWLEREDFKADSAQRLRSAAESYEASTQPGYLTRLPIRKRDEILLVSVENIASIVADGELLHITTADNEKHTITYRLKDIEARLDPESFVRLNRGTLANVSMIARVNTMPGGTYLITLRNDQQLPVSRLQSRVLREQLLRL